MGVFFYYLFALENFKIITLSFYQIIKMIFRKSKYVLIFNLLLIFTNCTAQSQLIKSELETVSVENIDYFLYFPKDYETTTKKYGILLFLHGSGDIPTDKNQKILPPKALTDGTEFPFLVLAPQLLAPRKMWNTKAIKQLLDTVVKNNRIDKNKIYLSGLSRGGAAAWNLAIEYPNTFAALAVVCGMAPTPYASWMDKELPIWVFHGEEDTSIPVSESEEMVAKLKSLGYDVKFTKYKGLGHEIWDVVYSNPELYKWLDKQEKK
ncbi:MAG: prolyl oligopeptidase family serine peptidase [Cellulophaga sp.]|nr:prolyl oligopeptidase family serine peptidase [Cellulophaga sp.]